MKKRDYAILLHRLQAVGTTRLVAECGGYPIYALELGCGLSETPSEWPLAVRAEAHLRALEVVLQRRLGA